MRRHCLIWNRRLDMCPLRAFYFVVESLDLALGYEEKWKYFYTLEKQLLLIFFFRYDCFPYSSITIFQASTCSHLYLTCTLEVPLHQFLPSISIILPNYLPEQSQIPFLQLLVMFSLFLTLQLVLFI